MIQRFSVNSQAIALRRGRAAAARFAVKALAPLAALLQPCVLCDDAAGQSPRFLRWEIEATVVEIGDPYGVFADLRTGDPARGTLTFDLGAEFDPWPSWGVYFSALQFEHVSLTIENPRTGGEVQFASKQSIDVVVYNDVPDDRGNDAILALQEVEPPAGYAARYPVSVVELYSPEVLGDTSLPTSLDLDDFPLAFISFQDLLVDGVYVYAEIYALTPVPVSFAPGDFNGTGTIDGDDRADWTQRFGVNGFADANDDGASDGHDFLVWQRRLSPSGVAHSGNPTPEPATLVLLAMGAWAFLARPRVAPPGGWRPGRQRRLAAGMGRSSRTCARPRRCVSPSART